MSPEDKVTALACHPSKKVIKAEELTHLFAKHLDPFKHNLISIF
jgi:hypothetical protein